MRAETVSPGEAIALRRARNFGLRLAFALAFGFAAALAVRSVLPFLVPLLALQILLNSPRPLPFAQGVGVVLMALVVAQFCVLVVGVLGDRPVVLLMLIGLVCFLCFAAQAMAKATAVVGLVLTIMVMTLVLGMAQIDLGASIVGILLMSMLAGLVLSWVAHALFPDPGGPLPNALKRHPLADPLPRAAANTLIVVAVLALCFSSSTFSTAIVVPLTVISLLSQADAAASGRTIGGLLVVNLFGGIVASIAFVPVTARSELALLFMLLLTIGLFFGGRAANPRDGRVYAGALMIFTIIFGLGVSPIPTTAPESFATRMGMLVIAVTIAACGIGLLWRADAPPVPAARARDEAAG
jgi:hypothetical protein